MKAKISVTQSRNILAMVDRGAGSRLYRSAFIECVLRDFFREQSRQRLHARDLRRINAAADRLNKEAEEVLKFQSFGPLISW